MKDEMVEIKEWYDCGVVVRRTINGVECPVDEWPDSVQIQKYSGIDTKMFMSYEDAKKRFGHYHNFPSHPTL